MKSLTHLHKVLFLGFIALTYILLYGATWLDMERVWRSDATYNHCYLIIPICLFFFYKAKEHPPILPIFDKWIALPCTGLVLLQLIWLFGYASDISLIMHFAAVVSLQAILWLIWGTSRSKAHWFAIAYLIFLVPFGQELNMPLQNITADLVVMMLHLVNIPVYREGLYLATPVGLFEVAEACSGLRFLIASLAISALYSYLHYNYFYKKIIFIVFMVVISILANSVRAFMLVYIGEKTNMRFGFGADHYLYGWLFFGAVLLAGFYLGAKFSDPAIALQKRDKHFFAINSNALVLTATSIILLVSLVFTKSLYVSPTPDKPQPIALSFLHNNITENDWGINFAYPLKQAYVQDNNKISYYLAAYSNKQTQGKLINWQNNLFDKDRWQVQKRINYKHYSVLQLKNLKNDYRTVLYYYQVGNHKATSTLKVKLYQALNFLKDDSSLSYVLALSQEGIINDERLQALERAAIQLANDKHATATHNTAHTGTPND